MRKTLLRRGRSLPHPAPSPHPWQQPVARPLRILPVAGQSGLKKSILKNRPDYHRQRCHGPGRQRSQRTQQQGECPRIGGKADVAGVPHKMVRPAATHRLAAIAQICCSSCLGSVWFPPPPVARQAENPCRPRLGCQPVLSGLAEGHAVQPASQNICDLDFERAGWQEVHGSLEPVPPLLQHLLGTRGPRQRLHQLGTLVYYQ